MTDSERGRMAVVLVTAIVVIAALVIHSILSDGSDFLTGFIVGIPVGAFLGWLADQTMLRLVDAYVVRLRGK